MVTKQDLCYDYAMAFYWLQHMNKINFSFILLLAFNSISHADYCSDMIKINSATDFYSNPTVIYQDGACKSPSGLNYILKKSYINYDLIKEICKTQAGKNLNNCNSNPLGPKMAFEGLSNITSNSGNYVGKNCNQNVLNEDRGQAYLWSYAYIQEYCKKRNHETIRVVTK